MDTQSDLDADVDTSSAAESRIQGLLHQAQTLIDRCRDLGEAWSCTFTFHGETYRPNRRSSSAGIDVWYDSSCEWESSDC